MRILVYGARVLGSNLAHLLLDKEFLKLKDKSGLNTPTYDKLRKSFIND